jgi:hypothetical protein
MAVQEKGVLVDADPVGEGVMKFMLHDSTPVGGPLQDVKTTLRR